MLAISDSSDSEDWSPGEDEADAAEEDAAAAGMEEGIEDYMAFIDGALTCCCPHTSFVAHPMCAAYRERKCTLQAPSCSWQATKEFSDECGVQRTHCVPHNTHCLR